MLFSLFLLLLCRLFIVNCFNTSRSSTIEQVAVAFQLETQAKKKQKKEEKKIYNLDKRMGKIFSYLFITSFSSIYSIFQFFRLTIMKIHYRERREKSSIISKFLLLPIFALSWKIHPPPLFVIAWRMASNQVTQQTTFNFILPCYSFLSCTPSNK